MKITIEEDIFNYITKIQCLNNNCKNNLKGAFCNLKNILINKNGNCFNFEAIENNINEKLER